MKITCLFLSAVLIGFICSCRSDQHSESNVNGQFRVPDSLNDHLLIATFYDADPAGYIILKYDNESRKSGKLIKFFESNEVYSQVVIPLNENKFRCAENNTEYEVFDKKVIGRAGGIRTENVCFATLPQEKEFKRTD